MNNFEQYNQLNNDDDIISMDEKNRVVLSNEALDWEEDYDSHFTPYRDLYSDFNYDF